MSADYGVNAESASAAQWPGVERRGSGMERRVNDRRRSTRGLFGKRARRGGFIDDRRRGDRRSEKQIRLSMAFWRRLGG